VPVLGTIVFVVLEADGKPLTIACVPGMWGKSMRGDGVFDRRRFCISPNFPQLMSKNGMKTRRVLSNPICVLKCRYAPSLTAS
jgi:hypothetical protein